METNTALNRLRALQQKDQREAEIMLAHSLLKAFPELTYGEALRHAYAKLRKERRQQE